MRRTAFRPQVEAVEPRLAPSSAVSALAARTVDFANETGHAYFVLLRKGGKRLAEGKIGPHGSLQFVLPPSVARAARQHLASVNVAILVAPDDPPSEALAFGAATPGDDFFLYAARGGQGVALAKSG